MQTSTQRINRTCFSQHGVKGPQNFPSELACIQYMELRMNRLLHSESTDIISFAPTIKYVFTVSVFTKLVTTHCT